MTTESLTVGASVAKEPIPAKSIVVKTDKPRPHICLVCTRGFARLEHLRRHERSHTKEKPYECPICERRFARRDLLLRHKQKLHAVFAESTKKEKDNKDKSRTPEKHKDKSPPTSADNYPAAVSYGAKQQPYHARSHAQPLQAPRDQQSRELQQRQIQQIQQVQQYQQYQHPQAMREQVPQSQTMRSSPMLQTMQPSMQQVTRMQQPSQLSASMQQLLRFRMQQQQQQQLQQHQQLQQQQQQGSPLMQAQTLPSQPRDTMSTQPQLIYTPRMPVDPAAAASPLGVAITPTLAQSLPDFSDLTPLPLNSPQEAEQWPGAELWPLNPVRRLSLRPSRSNSFSAASSTSYVKQKEVALAAPVTTRMGYDNREVGFATPQLSAVNDTSDGDSVDSVPLLPLDFESVLKNLNVNDFDEFAPQSALAQQPTFPAPTYDANDPWAVGQGINNIFNSEDFTGLNDPLKVNLEEAFYYGAQADDFMTSVFDAEAEVRRDANKFHNDSNAQTC